MDSCCFCWLFGMSSGKIETPTKNIGTEKFPWNSSAVRSSISKWRQLTSQPLTFPLLSFGILRQALALAMHLGRILVLPKKETWGGSKRKKRWNKRTPWVFDRGENNSRVTGTPNIRSQHQSWKMCVFLFEWLCLASFQRSYATDLQRSGSWVWFVWCLCRWYVCIIKDYWW